MTHSGIHSPALVALSILIAVLASYTALDLATRMRAAHGVAVKAWLAGAAVAMGGGVWSMHFVAMLAFSLPGVEVSFDLPLTLLSLALPIAVTAFGFLVANHRASIPALLGSGIVMGLGIAAMHYSGMAAMRMAADLRHEPLWIAVSLMIAIGAATTALWLSFRHSGTIQRLAAAVLMGLAVSGMHYAAMRGAVFTPQTEIGWSSEQVSLAQVHLALWVTATTFLILTLALVAALFDRHFATLADREAAAVRASEERFRLLIQSVTDYAIFMLDRDGRVAGWNSGAERIKGYSDKEIVGSHFSRFYTPEERAAGVPAQALQTAIEQGKFEAEGWRVRKDGSRFWASVVIDPVRNDSGEVVGFAKVTRDITERKAAQDALDKAREALVQAQKLEAIGQLTGGVAHDFNNLLMAILASLDLLRKRLPADDPKVQRLLDNAVLGAQRGASLTQRMLAFARRQNLEPIAVDLAALVRGMADLIQRSIGPEIRVETRFPLTLRPALVDANQLELAILNLVVNARDAMPSGGALTIGGREAAEWDWSRSPDNGYVCLFVEDTGNGMDAATLARAQEPFFTTKGVGKGTGLGLSMVHGLAEQSKGKLLLKSSPGEGTTAEIWLPVANAAVEDRTEASQPPPPANSMMLTILVVDDDALVLENTAAMLDDLGHSTVLAASGEEALDRLSSGIAVDVVLADFAMPGMNGGQLAEIIAADYPFLRVIIATGYAELPADMHSDLLRLKKPFDQNALSSALRDVKPASRGDLGVDVA
jgi:PAS domain S-box-containing protein